VTDIWAGCLYEGAKFEIESRSNQEDWELKMKKIAFATAATLLLTGAASAADMAARPYTKAPAPIMLAYNWTGFYVGVNGGGGWTDKCWDIVTPTGALVGAEGCHNASGGTVGGQIGYRWQASNWVFGVEAQGNWADFTGSRVSQQFILVPGDASSRTNLRAFGLFTGQIGYAWNNALIYVKGGAAVTDDRYEHRVIATNTVFDSANETRWGGVVGVGLEYGFTPNWSAALEYDHMFMGTQTLNFRNAAGALSTIDRIGQDVDVVTARINYRFGGPIVAKY
jgi:outer membrane immunogenic protein